MGGLVSYMKKLWRRITKGTERDRWVRSSDEEKGLLSDDRQKPAYRPIPPRIDRQVIIDSHTEDFPRKRPEAPPSPNLHANIHERQISRLLVPDHRPRPSSSVFEDSLGPWEREGNERRGINFLSVEEDESENESDDDEEEWRDEGTTNGKWREIAIDEEARRNAGKVAGYEGVHKGPVPEETTQTAGNDYVPQPAVADDPALATGDDADDDEEGCSAEDEPRPAAYQLERYDVPVHTFNSDDASWMQNLHRFFPK